MSDENDFGDPIDLVINGWSGSLSSLYFEHLADDPQPITVVAILQDGDTPDSYREPPGEWDWDCFDSDLLHQGGHATSDVAVVVDEIKEGLASLVRECWHRGDTLFVIFHQEGDQ